MSGPTLEAMNLAAGHHGRPVFESIALAVHPGEIVALLGPNGCGKTTLLRCLVGVHRPMKGAVRVEGKRIENLSPSHRAACIAYVPQYHRQAFGYRVLDIVLMGRLAGRGMLARPSRDDVGCALDILAGVGLADHAELPYTELSGGQRQLVLIARALAQEVPLLVLDEPVNNLDYGNQWRLLDRLKQLVDPSHAVLFTTHHPEHALHVASRAVLMKQGHLLANGAPESVLHESAIRDLYGLHDQRFPAPGRLMPGASHQSYPARTYHHAET